MEGKGNDMPGFGCLFLGLVGEGDGIRPEMEEEGVGSGCQGAGLVDFDAGRRESENFESAKDGEREEQVSEMARWFGLLFCVVRAGGQ